MRLPRAFRPATPAFVAVLFGAASLLVAQDPPAAPRPADAPPAADKPADASATPPAEKPAEAGPTRDAKGRVKLSPQYEVWLDREAKELHVAGEVCARSGQLEMLVTRKGTKTHEAVVAVDCEAKVIHAGLMALGAEPGRTVRFSPQYQPAEGPEIEVAFRWTDGNGKEHATRGQDWVRQVQTQRVMDSPFVFAGSMFSEGQYLAEQGDVVCVSNFPTAMLDLPVRSSDQAAQLMFEAFAERIPPVRTPVTVVFRYKPAAAPAGR